MDLTGPSVSALVLSPFIRSCPGCRAVASPRHFLPMCLPVLQSTSASRQPWPLQTHLHPPSFLGAHWPCCHSQPGLCYFACSSDVESAVVFSSAYRRISNLFMGHPIRNSFILVPSQGQAHGPCLFLLFPSSQWLLWSISNKISDGSSKTISGVFSSEYLCFSTGYMGSIAQITSPIWSLNLQQELFFLRWTENISNKNLADPRLRGLANLPNGRLIHISG